MEFEPTLNVNGYNIKKLREKDKLTQLYLATVVGVTTETISRWENRRYPTIKKENALKLAKALQVPLDELLDKQEPPSSSTLAVKGLETQGAVQPRTAQPAWKTNPFRLGRVRRLFVILPLCLGLPLFVGLFILKGREVEVTAIRHLPDHVLPAQVFPVLIEVSASSSESATLMLREAMPKQCLSIMGAPPFTGAGENGQVIKWIGKIEEKGRDRFVYLAKLRENAVLGHRLSFSGDFIIGRDGGLEKKISGDQETEVSAFHWADKNRDSRIDDYEILSVYELFPNYRELGLDLAEIEQLWASRGYHWNSETKTVETKQK